MSLDAEQAVMDEILRTGGLAITDRGGASEVETYGLTGGEDKRKPNTASLNDAVLYSAPGGQPVINLGALEAWLSRYPYPLEPNAEWAVKYERDSGDRYLKALVEGEAAGGLERFYLVATAVNLTLHAEAPGGLSTPLGERVKEEVLRRLRDVSETHEYRAGDATRLSWWEWLKTMAEDLDERGQ